jgi:uncharacterized protein
LLDIPRRAIPPALLRCSTKATSDPDGSEISVSTQEPVLCLVGNVEEAFMHCPKAMVRSKMWKPDEWPDRSNVPTMMESVKANAKAVESLEELQRNEDIVTVTRLY